MALHMLISTLSRGYILSPSGQVPPLCVTLLPSQCQLLKSYSCSVWIMTLTEKRDREKLAIRESKEDDGRRQGIQTGCAFTVKAAERLPGYRGKWGKEMLVMELCWGQSN